MPATLPDGAPWPRVSIVTPSFNQSPFLEETIRSVLAQGYPDLEYIVIDGGSSDGSVDIIRRYAPWLAYWVSEPDAGQSDALNKGFRRATGDIVAWINSDDSYLPGALSTRVQELVARPGAVLVYGDCDFVDEGGRYLRTWSAGPCNAKGLLLEGNAIPQQSVFMRAWALKAAGYVDPAYHYIMDYELWVRLGLLGELVYVPGPVASFRHHTSSKSVTVGARFAEETLNWLAAREKFVPLLDDGEYAEVLRRQNINAAMEYLLAGEEERAVEHVKTALAAGIYPFGDVETLATRMADFSGLGGQSMHDDWRWVEALGRALYLALPRPRARALWRRVASRYHMHFVFRDDWQRCLPETRSHLIRGVMYDPRWLRNPGVISIGLEVLGGHRPAGELRRAASRVRRRALPHHGDST